MRGKTGFTLTELLIVVLIISIMAGLSIPRFKNTFDGLQLKNSAFNVYKLIHFAKEKAIMNAKPFRVRLDSEKNTFALYEMSEFPPEGDSENKEIFKRVAGKLGKLNKLPESISMESSVEGIDCFADGHCDPAEIELKLGESIFTIKVTAAGVKLEEA